MFPKYTLLFTILFPLSIYSQKDSTAARYSLNVTAGGMSKNLHILASDEYEGRETGKKGQKMAAEYIAARFKESGIPPYKENSYYQEFPVNVILPAPADITVNGKKFKGNKDFYNFPGLTEQKTTSATVVFLGYGIEEEKYNDYRTDIKDKIVMVLGGEPYSKDSISLITGKKSPSLWSTYYKTKSEKIREKGALALLIVVDDIEKEMAVNKHRLEKPAMVKNNQGRQMPVIYVSKEMADQILKKNSVEKIKNKISGSGASLNLELKREVTINVINTAQKLMTENVLGFVEGSDLKNEVVVITAHYDHLGKDENVVYNGADDDGSGTVAVIELAKVFAQAKKDGKGPRRSMLFMTVSGEEKGLLGSSYYVDHPEYPLENTVCDLNIDMIGRLDERHSGNPNYIYLIGSDKLSSELHAISEKANSTYTNLELDYTYNDEKDKNRFYYRSDHYNFAKNGIPVIFYFNGVHADYHKETDEVEKIDFAKMEKITRLVFFTAWEVANRNERIKVDSNKK
ncbi:MAG TPA: M28 family peptidase [Bacteroidia bacterium]|jgi:hypothetical protein